MNLVSCDMGGSESNVKVSSASHIYATGTGNCILIICESRYVYVCACVCLHVCLISSKAVLI